MNLERVQIVDSFRMLRVNGIKPTESFVIYPTILSIAGIRSSPNLPEHQVKCSQSGNSFPEFLDASWINNCRKLVTGSQSQWCLWISEDLYERQDLLGKALMTSFAEMLDLPPETFAQCFEGGVHTRVWRQWRLECQMKLQDSNHSVWKAHGRCMVLSELDDADVCFWNFKDRTWARFACCDIHLQRLRKKQHDDKLPATGLALTLTSRCHSLWEVWGEQVGFNALLTITMNHN